MQNLNLTINPLGWPLMERRPVIMWGKPIFDDFLYHVPVTFLWRKVREMTSENTSQDRKPMKEWGWTPTDSSSSPKNEWGWAKPNIERTEVCIVYRRITKESVLTHYKVAGRPEKVPNIRVGWWIQKSCHVWNGKGTKALGFFISFLPPLAYINTDFNHLYRKDVSDMDDEDKKMWNGIDTDQGVCTYIWESANILA